MKNKDLHGLGVALVTPFTVSGDVDHMALKRMVDYHIDNHTDFLCVLGTTAETPTLTAQEQISIRNTIIQRNAGRLPILLGCGGNCTRNVVDTLSRDTMEGVDAILSVVPYYNKPTQEGIYSHFKAISESTDLPIVLYNVPGRTSVNMLPDTTLRLASDFKNIIGIKEASGSIEQIGRIIENRPQGFKVFSGDDGITLQLMAKGADGVISVIGNAYAAEFARLVHESVSGDMSIASSIDTSLEPMYSLLFADGNPAGIKCLMALRGMLNNEVLRLPLVPATQETRDKMSALIRG